MTGADLFGASLISASLSDAILRDANLFSANLTWTACHRTDFTGATLNHMNASSASFTNATLNFFEYAILIFANFERAVGKLSLRSQSNLLWNTTMPDGTVEKGPYIRN
ncbi:pentapeptide repeat protein [Chondrocystis sp. NIES-4102]|nr:pentapeptide repeat protein [Chondrocystis sp. NIES-4102]